MHHWSTSLFMASLLAPHVIDSNTFTIWPLIYTTLGRCTLGLPQRKLQGNNTRPMYIVAKRQGSQGMITQITELCSLWSCCYPIWSTPINKATHRMVDWTHQDITLVCHLQVLEGYSWSGQEYIIMLASTQNLAWNFLLRDLFENLLHLTT